MNSEQLEKLHAIASKKTPEVSLQYESGLVQQSVDYLASCKALESIEADPYWPKWDSPWWQMLLLHEMGLTSHIPSAIVEAIIDALDSYYLKVFPFTESEVPVGVDPLNQVACHCQLGTMHQLLTAYGVDVDSRLPWLRPWYLRYQLNDGGLNCDGSLYKNGSEELSSVHPTSPGSHIYKC